MNTSEIHKKLHDDTYQKQFFEYWESIIKHNVPDVDEDVPSDYEPRTQRPPIPPSIPPNADFVTDSEWLSIYSSEVKKCAEVLQRHICRPVCHKYGHESNCRFNFPHDFVEFSHFDKDINSVILACCDPYIN